MVSKATSYVCECLQLWVMFDQKPLESIFVYYMNSTIVLLQRKISKCIKIVSKSSTPYLEYPRMHTTPHAPILCLYHYT